MEVVTTQINWRPPLFVGRDDMETLMASDNSKDWIRLTEMILGPTPEGYFFTPKHKSNAYEKESDLANTVCTSQSSSSQKCDDYE